MIFFLVNNHALHVLEVKTNPTPVTGDDCLWITKWVDYSHKYGFGFQLSNHISGASFKDGLSIAVNGDNR